MALAWPSYDRAHARINPHSRWGRGMAFAWVLDYAPSEGVPSVYCRVRGIRAFGAGTLITKDNWVRRGERFVFSSGTALNAFTAKTPPFRAYPFSVYLLLKFAALADQTIWSVTDPADVDSFLRVRLRNSGKLAVAVSNDLTLQSAGALSTGTLYHVVLVVQGDSTLDVQLYFWADGAATYTQIVSQDAGVTMPFLPSATEETIGGAILDDFEGDLHHVVGWHDGLTEDEVLALLRDPYGVYRALEPPREDHTAFPAAIFESRFQLGGVNMRGNMQ